MRRAAFLTMDGLDPSHTYDHLAVPPLRERGWAVEEVPWRSGADWDAYEAVVVRTPWDYQDDPEAFLGVLEQIEASRARLANPLVAVRWNLDKRYLRELEGRGVPVVPTRWGRGLTRDALADLYRRLGEEVVVKPTVGASAVDTFRLVPGAPHEEAALAAFADRPFMAQGFVRSITEWGEASLFYFGSAFSHAIQKTPAAGDFRVQEEYGSRLMAFDPEPRLHKEARRAVREAVAITGADLLYARADLVRLDDGAWALMELELVEPSLYFPWDPASPAHFADAFCEWMGRHHGP